MIKILKNLTKTKTKTKTKKTTTCPDCEKVAALESKVLDLDMRISMMERRVF